MYISSNIYIYIYYITAIWHPHAVKLRSCKLVFIPCRITETSPACHSALSFGAQATSIQSQCSILTFNRQKEGEEGEEGGVEGIYHYKRMLNRNQRPVISHSPARTKVTQFLAIYNKFKTGRGCGRLICLLGLTLSERAQTRVNPVASELLLNKSPPGVVNLKPPLRIA